MMNKKTTENIQTKEDCTIFMPQDTIQVLQNILENMQKVQKELNLGLGGVKGIEDLRI